jgi:hypothetical protein
MEGGRVYGCAFFDAGLGFSKNKHLERFVIEARVAEQPECVWMTPKGTPQKFYKSSKNWFQECAFFWF